MIGRKKLSSGQSMVEFALVMPVILMLILGLMEFSRLMWVYFGVTSASREAARYGSAIDIDGNGTPRYLDCNGIRDVAKQIGAPGNVQDGNISISYDRGPGSAQLSICPLSSDIILLGDRLIVQVVGSFGPASEVPLFDFPSFEISSITHRTIIKEALLEATPGP